MYAPERKTDARIKRQRVGGECSREMFVKASIAGNAATLKGDASFGNNSCNRIRKRLATILDDMEKATTKATPVSPGRAVLEARFAMGHDDAQYLAQSVTALWAGDGGERLRLTHNSSMPYSVKATTAGGMIAALRAFATRQTRQHTERLKGAAKVAAWLLCISEVRDGVVAVLAATERGDVGTALLATYETGESSGKEYVEAMAESSRAELATLLETLYFLTCDDAVPCMVVEALTSSARRVVYNAQRDTQMLAGLAQLNLQTDPSGLVGVVGKNAARQGAQHGPVTTDSYGRSDATIVPTAQLAVYEASRRMRACTEEALILQRDNNDNSTVYTVAEGDDMQNDRRKRAWALKQHISPFADLLPDKSKTTADQSVGGQQLDSIVAKCVVEHQSSGPHTSQRVQEPALPHTACEFECVAFCVLRGLCGYRGPHQQAGDADGSVLLKYNFPTSLPPPQSFNLHSVHTDGQPGRHAKRTQLNAQRRIQLMQEYGDALSHQSSIDLYNSDFVGDVLRMDNMQSVAYANRGGGFAYTTEAAKCTRWAPLMSNDGSDRTSVDFEREYAEATCEASMLEFMIASLKMRSEHSSNNDQKSVFKTAAAAAKLKQLAPLTLSRSVSHTTGDFYLPNSQGEVCVTRPCHSYSAYRNDSNCKVSELLLPVDAGIARFATVDSNETQPFIIDSAWADAAAVSNSFRPDEPVASAYELAGEDDKDNNGTWGPNSPSHHTAANSKVCFFGGNENTVPHTQLSNALRSGIEQGFSSTRIGAKPQHYSLYIATSAGSTTASPLDEKPRPCLNRDLGVKPRDLSRKQLMSHLAEGIMAIDALLELEVEKEYLDKLKNESSQERRLLMPTRNLEEAAFDRRSDIWSDAMRELAVSGDRLYRFVVSLTGSIGESAETAIAWEDEELAKYNKESSKRASALRDDVSKFHAKLVESTLQSTMKASNLQLDLRRSSESDAANHDLVVVSSDVKESARRVATGEAGLGFFEASVALQNLVNGPETEMKMRDVMLSLSHITQDYSNQLSLQASHHADANMSSYGRIAEPRNSFMIHLKPDVSAAIQKSFDYTCSELRIHGITRHVHLWEMIEGKDWTLSSRFAELVGMMLQHTRMRSGTFAAYVGTSQLVTNAHNIRTQLRRVVDQARDYADKTHAPNFLQHNARSTYFGGTEVKPPTPPTPKDGKKPPDPQKQYDDSIKPFASRVDNDSDDDDSDDDGNDGDRTTRRRLIRQSLANQRELRRSILNKTPGAWRGRKIASKREARVVSNAAEGLVKRFGPEAVAEEVVRDLALRRAEQDDLGTRLLGELTRQGYISGHERLRRPVPREVITLTPDEQDLFVAGLKRAHRLADETPFQLDDKQAYRVAGRQFHVISLKGAFDNDDAFLMDPNKLIMVRDTLNAATHTDSDFWTPHPKWLLQDSNRVGTFIKPVLDDAPPIQAIHVPVASQVQTWLQSTRGALGSFARAVYAERKSLFKVFGIGITLASTASTVSTSVEVASGERGLRRTTSAATQQPTLPNPVLNMDKWDEATWPTAFGRKVKDDKANTVYLDWPADADGAPAYAEIINRHINAQIDALSRPLVKTSVDVGEALDVFGIAEDEWVVSDVADGDEGTAELEPDAYDVQLPKLLTAKALNYAMHFHLPTYVLNDVCYWDPVFPWTQAAVLNGMSWLQDVITLPGDMSSPADRDKISLSTYFESVVQTLTSFIKNGLQPSGMLKDASEGAQQLGPVWPSVCYKAAAALFAATDKYQSKRIDIGNATQHFALGIGGENALLDTVRTGAYTDNVGSQLVRRAFDAINSASSSGRTFSRQATMDVLMQVKGELNTTEEIAFSVLSRECNEKLQMDRVRLTSTFPIMQFTEQAAWY